MRDLEGFRDSLEERKRSFQAEAMEGIEKLERIMKENKELLGEAAVGPDDLTIIAPSPLPVAATHDGAERTPTPHSIPDYFSFLEACQQAHHKYDLLNALVEKRKQAVPLLQEVAVLRERGQIDRGLELLAEILKDNPGYPRAAALQMELLAQREREERTEANLLRAEQAEPLGNLERAAALARAVLAEDATHAKALALLERVEAELGRRMKAEDRQRGWVARLLGQARVAISNKQFAEAIQALDEILRLRADRPDVLEMRRRTLADLIAKTTRQGRRTEVLRETLRTFYTHCISISAGDWKSSGLAGNAVESFSVLGRRSSVVACAGSRRFILTRVILGQEADKDIPMLIKLSLPIGHTRLTHRAGIDRNRDKMIVVAVIQLSSIVVRAVFASLRRRARDRSRIRQAQCGAVTFVPRFGDALNRTTSAGAEPQRVTVRARRS